MYTPWGSSNASTILHRIGNHCEGRAGRVLLTGIAGFAGSFLADYLVRETDAEVHGVVHRHDHRIAHLAGRAHLHRGDLRNALWVSEVVQGDPARLHAAPGRRGATSAARGGSRGRPTNSTSSASFNLLEALCAAGSRPAAPSSSHPMRSTAWSAGRFAHRREHALPSQPPYGVSKLAQDMMALQYFNSHQMPIVRASFNHLGPGQADDFAASAFARQIAEIELGLHEPVVHVGNL